MNAARPNMGTRGLGARKSMPSARMQANSHPRRIRRRGGRSLDGSKLLIETGDGWDQSPLTIDLAALIGNVQSAAKEQVAYMVDIAEMS